MRVREHRRLPRDCGARRSERLADGLAAACPATAEQDSQLCLLAIEKAHHHTYLLGEHEIAERLDQVFVPRGVHQVTAANANERGRHQRQFPAVGLTVVVICENVRPERRDHVLALYEAALVHLDRMLGDHDHTSNPIASPQDSDVTFTQTKAVKYFSQVGDQCLQELL